jgi:hypothetical protein
VVWVDPQQLESRRLALLERYVRAGGGLMVFLGGSNRALWQDRGFRSFIGITGATERRNASESGYTSFQEDHPVFNIFDEEELELLSRTRVNSYVSASGVAPDSVLAYVGTGDPAVWEVSRGSGRILVFAAAPNLESGDIPLSPMFLPLVHTSVSYLASAGGAQRRSENFAGAQLHFPVNETVSRSARLVIRDPEGQPLDPVIADTPQGERRVICERPRAVGVYELRSDTTVVSQAVVNLDTRESNVTIHSLVTPDERSHVVETSGDFAGNLREKRHGREIYGFFILLAAAALVAESVLGRKA